MELSAGTEFPSARLSDLAGGLLADPSKVTSERLSGCGEGTPEVIVLSGLLQAIMETNRTKENRIVKIVSSF